MAGERESYDDYDQSFIDKIKDKENPLEHIECDVQLDYLGYKCKGPLDALPFYRCKGVSERLWLWEKDGEPPVITFDKDNGWCTVIDLKNITSCGSGVWPLPQRDIT